MRELRNFEAKIKSEITVIEDELKAEMLAWNTDTLQGQDCTVTWKPVRQRGVPADPCGAVPTVQQGHHQPPVGDRLT